MKICLGCKEPKELTEFGPDRRRKGGIRSVCRKCYNAISNRYYYNNKEKVYQCTRRWMEKVPEKIRGYSKRRRENNPQKCYEATRAWLKKHPEKVKEYNYRKNIKQRGTIKGRLMGNMKSYLAYCLKGTKAGRHWEDLVGYKVEDLKKHLEENFLPGMSWENRNLWHIDHKIPISAFNFERPEDIDFKRCWGLGNLQPMWALQNISKKDKIVKPFQPSLLLAWEDYYGRIKDSLQ